MIDRNIVDKNKIEKEKIVKVKQSVHTKLATLKKQYHFSTMSETIDFLIKELECTKN